MNGNLALPMIVFGFLVYAINRGAFGRLLFVIGFRNDLPKSKGV